MFVRPGTASRGCIVVSAAWVDGDRALRAAIGYTPPMTHGGKRTASGAYRELTVSAIIFAIIVGAVMNAAITYAGLKIGFTIVGSAIAAVLGFGVLRGLLRRGSILETNIAQTVASAINTTNAGVIFTVPVLLLLGMRLDPSQRDFWMITLACSAGAILGVVFIVPLRKQMLDIDRLRFPSATAVGAILKSPGAGAAKSVVLVIGVVIGAALYLPSGLPSITRPATLEDLDRLVDRERITQGQADLTRTIAAWIEQQAAPEAVIEKGRLVRELRSLRATIDARSQEKVSDEDQAAIAEAQARIRAVPGAESISDALAAAVHEVVVDQRPWDRLRGSDTGWARHPLWGYQDLQIRVPARTDKDNNLTADTDRNGDGRPDLAVTDSTLDVGRIIGLPGYMQLAFAIAPFALGAGYLTGRAGLMVLAGGVLAYLFLNPIAYQLGWVPATMAPHQAPGYALGAFNRPLGIGLLLGGAMMGVIFSLPAMREAIRSIARAGRSGNRTARSDTRDEMGLLPLVVIGMAAMAVLLIAAEFVGDPTASTGGWLSGLPPILARVVIVLVAGAWIWFAGVIIAQCTGMTDWSPISGMALLTVVLVMMLAGTADVMSAVLIGAALCVAISCASDMMADLKTGYIVGSIPRRQQIAEIAFAAIGPVITMATLVLIASVNMKQSGVPIGPGTETVAPQAQALQAVITGVQGGQMPYMLYGLGAALGALLGLGAFPGLGVLVGLSMYLPIIYILTYGVGCVANMVVGKIKGRAWAEEWGVPLCAGLIVGEAVLALLINSIVLLQG